MFFRSKSVLEELGVVYDTDGNAYKLYSTNRKLNKSMIDMYQKFNLELRSQVILKKADSEIEPEYAKNIVFDFTKSNESVNKIFINNFLSFPYNIQPIVERSILTKDMVMEIWNNSLYRTEFVESSILVNQDIFSDKEFVDNLQYNQLWIAFTQNKTRTIDKMSKYAETFRVFLEYFFSDYLYAEFIKDMEIKGEWKRLINETIERFFPNIDIISIKEKVRIKIDKDIKEYEQKMIGVNLKRKAIENYLDKMDRDEVLIKDAIIDDLLTEKFDLTSELNLRRKYLDIIYDSF